jgi:hypothetical protein
LNVLLEIYFPDHWAVSTSRLLGCAWLALEEGPVCQPRPRLEPVNGISHPFASDERS